MKEEIWKNNAAVLRERYGRLLDEITSQDNKDNFPYEIKMETAPTGDLTMSINGLSVHSPRDPAREGERLAQAVESSASQPRDAPIVILGFGLGYVAQYAASLGRPVIIAEKYLKILRTAFEQRDLTDLLTKENIIFIAGGTGDGISCALNAVYDLYSKEDAPPIPAIIRNRALMELDNEWYKNIEEKIRTYSMKDKVNTATLKRFGKRWVRNIVWNMSAIRDVSGINMLTQRSGGAAEDLNFPVFLAAAGPSLDKIKPYLKDVYDRCIIVAVDTNLRFFTNNGIQPDFVLTVDPQFWNSRHLDRCTDSEAVREKTALVIESAVFPPILRLPFKRKFLCGSLFPLSSFIENQVDLKGRLGAGGSVATTAWDFAKIVSNEQLAMSNDKNVNIWIAGLDLSFPDYRTHFRGARFEEKANSESNRFNPVETWIVRALRDGIPFKAKSAAGGHVLTDSRLSLYAAWFENQFSQNKNIRNRALFNEGLAINGLQSADIEEFLALPVRRKEIDKYLENCFTQIEKEFYSPEEMRKRSGRYDAAVESLIQGLNSIKKSADEGIKLINNGRKDSVKELDRIMKKIAESEVKEITSFLMPIGDNEEKTEADYFKSSLKLFSSLSESAGYYLELLNLSR